ncbi:MAG: hypothetical protein IJZ53_13220 [Tyzzerella sp.]|nr:hypothetical protein [Tyzzerella sp.]
MRKYEEKNYLFENFKDKIYPWIKESLVDHAALNGKYISPNDTPIISFVGDLMIIFAIKRGEDKFEILKDNMLPPGTDMAELYHIACQNLVRDVEFVISNTMYGGFGILADGHHEASSLCFKHIWSLCVDKIQDDLAIMVPAKDMVLFVPASDEKAITAMKNYGLEAFERNKDKISKKLLRFTKEEKELVVYE